jgi:hypothetical protein
MNILTDCRGCKMNQQMMKPMKFIFPTVASLLRSVKNMVIKYQAKLFPFVKAFFGLRLSGLPLVSCVSGGSGQKRAGNIWDAIIYSGGLLLIVTASLATGGCSTALITAGVLDGPAQERMFSAMDRAELEVLSGKPIVSRTNADGKVVDLYSYIDGEAGVVGKSGRRPMGGERTARAIVTLLSAGMFEVALVPAALHERSEATREFYVVYTPDNSILTICYPRYVINVPNREESLCDSEPATVVIKDH